MKRVGCIHPGVYVDVHGEQVLPLPGQLNFYENEAACSYKEDNNPDTNYVSKLHGGNLNFPAILTL